MLTNDFIYGMCGGTLGTFISHPFDTIKTRIQSNKVNSIMQAIKLKNLYSGITPPMIGIMLEKSIVFGFYNKSKEYGYSTFWSGIIGGFMSTLIVTPVDRVKIIFQNKEKLSLIKISTLYRGFIPTVCRETPGFGIYFSTYQYLTTNYNKNNELYKSFCFGSMSGLNAWIFIYPSDLIKTKMQSNSLCLHETIKSIYYDTLHIGLHNFYKGFKLAILRAMPLHGGVFLGYELSKKYM
jgi:solute carrier family 25 carnitine/acylcarnitine transporter 20/29